MPDMVFSIEYRNWHTVNALAIAKKCLDVGDKGFSAISICSSVQPQLNK